MLIHTRHARVASSATSAVLVLLAAACSSSSGGSSPTGDAGHQDSAVTSDTGTGDDAGGTHDGSSVTDAPAGDGSASQACTDEAMALCALRQSCTSNGYYIDKYWGNLTVCQTRTAANCVSTLSAPNTSDTAAHVQACAQAYPSESCTDYFDGNTIAACSPTMGSAATGAACSEDGECSSAFCQLGAGHVCGACQPQPAVGTSCQVQADCGKDLACAIPGTATIGACAAFVTSGGACLTGTSPCAAGLSCVGDDPTTNTMGKCGAAGSMVGTACDGTRKTAASCDGDLGLSCIPTAKGSAVGTCQAVTLVAAGTTCGSMGTDPITSVAECEAGGLCLKAASTDATGTCVAPAADGAACNSDPTVGPPCLTPAKCVPTSDGGTAGTCTLPGSVTCP